MNILEIINEIRSEKSEDTSVVLDTLYGFFNKIRGYNTQINELTPNEIIEAILELNPNLDSNDEGLQQLIRDAFTAWKRTLLITLETDTEPLFVETEKLNDQNIAFKINEIIKSYKFALKIFDSLFICCTESLQMLNNFQALLSTLNISTTLGLISSKLEINPETLERYFQLWKRKKLTSEEG